MMKLPKINRTTIFLVLIMLLTAGISQAYAQILQPVKWSFNAIRLNDTEAELQFIATIDKGWHIYSQIVIDPENGPNPTIFTFDKPVGYKLAGKVSEPKPIKEYDDMFKMVVKYFEQKAVFTQKITITSDKPIKVTGNVDFEGCDDKQCMVDNVPYTLQLEGAKTGAAPATIPSETQAKSATVDSASATNASPKSDAPAKINVTVSKSSGFDGNNSTLWWFFLQAFGWGLLAILTPCVFPMIPMTVSYFMKSGSKGKVQAVIYGLSIIVIYVLFGVVISVLFGADFGNWLSTHWIPNVLFFLIFIAFAASFFGYFEITIPSWLVNKSVQNEEKGGVMGTIFMAMTLVLVSFSCTGPIVGTIVVQAVGGQVIKPVIGMLGFSLAFAIPFTLFAFFPQWLNKMPKSGGWLNSVKVVLGFIELAFALKFLNVPDQTYHWGILDREVYLGFWIVIFTMMGFYLLGKIRFPHDGDYPAVKSFPRLMLIIITFTFVIYLVPGLWGAPLKGISGWLPPMETQDFDVNAIIRDNPGNGNGTAKIMNITESPKYADRLKLPHGLQGYFDYDQALKVSKELNKPVFVDFTGHGCTNCREMENRVWSDPQVLKRLRENFVLVALYVDDKVIEMPKEEWYTNAAGRKVKLLGKKNTEIQINLFKANAQPFYVMLDADGNLLVPAKAYDLDIDAFVKFLDSGVSAFNQKTIN